MNFDYNSLDQETKDKLEYFYFLTMLVPFETAKNEISQLSSIIDNIYQHNQRGWDLPKITNNFKNEIDELIPLFEQILKPKKSDWKSTFTVLSEAFKDSDSLNNKIIVNNYYLKKYNVVGIQYFKLLEIFDLSHYSLPPDLPFSAFILPGAEKIDWIIEEYFTLDMAVNFLFKAEYFFHLYGYFAFKAMFGTFQDKELCNHVIGLVKFYSSQSIICFVNFIEIFINSIAFNFFLGNKNTLTEENELLKNIYCNVKNNDLYPLTKKLPLLPLLIKRKILNKNDYNDLIKGAQSHKPKVNFINNTDKCFKIKYKEFIFIKDLRDDIVHYHGENGKISILSNSLIWIEFARLAFDQCIRIAKITSEKCGFDIDNHKYMNLDKKFWIERGMSRINFEQLVMNSGINLLLGVELQEFNQKAKEMVQKITDKFKNELQKSTNDFMDYGIKLPFEIK